MNKGKRIICLVMKRVCNNTNFSPYQSVDCLFTTKFNLKDLHEFKKNIVFVCS